MRRERGRIVTRKVDNSQDDSARVDQPDQWKLRQAESEQQRMAFTTLARRRVRTLGICVAVAAMCVGYFARFGRVDATTDGGVSVVAAVAATGAIVNAVSLYRER